MKYGLIIALALLLPLGVAIWVLDFPSLTAPWLFGVPTAILVALGTWPFAEWLKRIPHLEDRLLSIFLATVYLIIPAGALVLLLNQSIDLSTRTVNQVVMNRFPETPDGSSIAWIFLWTGNHVDKMKVPSSDPLYLCMPGDSIKIRFAQGLLGLEYRDHVDRIQ